MRRILRSFDAALGGFTLGEKAREGERDKVLLIGAALLLPLMLKKRVAMLAFALGVAALSYYFFEEMHEREAVLEPVAHDPTMN